MENAAAVTALAALAQATRLEVFRALVVAGPRGISPGAMCGRLGIPPATLSFHLKELKNSGLLHCEREGRSLLYSADFATMQSLLAYLTENCCTADRGGPCAPTGPSGPRQKEKPSCGSSSRSTSTISRRQSNTTRGSSARR